MASFFLKEEEAGCLFSSDFWFHLRGMTFCLVPSASAKVLDFDMLYLAVRLRAMQADTEQAIFEIGVDHLDAVGQYKCA